MLPYYPQPVFSLGPFRIHAFAVFAVAAILVARWIILHRGRRFGITYEEIAPLYLTIVIAALGGSVAIASLNADGAISSIGAIAGGLVGAVGCCVVRRCSWTRAVTLVDIAAFAAPFAAAVGRLGCTIAHDHRGLPSNRWLAIQFPEGSRYDLGLVDFLFLTALCGLYLVLDRTHKPRLFFAGLGACAYGAFRVWRQALEPTPSILPWAFMCVAGFVVLVSAGCHIRFQREERLIQI